MAFGQHPLMEDAGYGDPVGSLSIEDYVSLVLGPPEILVEAHAGATKERAISKLLKVRFDRVQVSPRLSFAPDAKSVGSNVFEVGSCANR